MKNTNKIALFLAFILASSFLLGCTIQPQEKMVLSEEGFPHRLIGYANTYQEAQTICINHNEPYVTEHPESYIFIGTTSPLSETVYTCSSYGHIQ